MNISQIFAHSTKGNKTTPADERKTGLQSIFQAKKNFAVQVLEASEKNVGINSSHRDSDDNDSDSSSDFDDFVFEENGIITGGKSQQVSMPTMLIIKPKDVDEIDASPMVTDRRAMKQSLFLTKVRPQHDAEDSDSSSDCGDFLEHVSDDFSEQQNVQVAMQTSLYITVKNPNTIDVSPVVTHRKSIDQSVFQTKVHPSQKIEQQFHMIDLQKQTKSASGKANMMKQNMLLCETA